MKINRQELQDQAIEDAKALAADLRARRAERLEDLVVLLDSLTRQSEQLDVDMERAQARLTARNERAQKLEGLILDRAARGVEIKRHDRRCERLTRLQGLVAKSRLRVEILTRRQSTLPEEIERVMHQAEAARAALSEDGLAALDLRSAQYGLRRLAVLMGEADDAYVKAHGDRARAKAERGYDRDGPTPELAGKRGWAQDPGEPVKRPTSVTPGELKADVPDTVRRLVSKKKLTESEARAAEIYRQDHEFGTARSKLVSSYEMGVSGGGNRAQEVSLGKLMAYERWKKASECLPHEMREVVNAVVLYDVTLDSAPGIGSEYSSGETNRRASNGVLLVAGLKRLCAYYGWP